MTVQVVADSRRNRSPDKPNEDAYAVRLDMEGAVLVVADGVTRSRAPDGSYPDPSGAAAAARLVAQTLVSALVGPAQPNLRHAFTAANRAVAEANRNAGVWERLDYHVHDLWCAVATAAVIRGAMVYWGHIGDTALLHLAGTGETLVPTPDQVAGAAQLLQRTPLPEIAAAGGREPYARRRLRNRPEVPGSYGALTGEPMAARYVVTGAFHVASGDRLALCTDGLGSLRQDTNEYGWAALARWLRGPLHENTLSRLMDAVETADEQTAARSDDKTVVLAEINE